MMGFRDSRSGFLGLGYNFSEGPIDRAMEFARAAIAHPELDLLSPESTADGAQQIFDTSRIQMLEQYMRNNNQTPRQVLQMLLEKAQQNGLDEEVRKIQSMLQTHLGFDTISKVSIQSVWVV